VFVREPPEQQEVRVAVDHLEAAAAQHVLHAVAIGAQCRNLRERLVGVP